MKIRLLGWSLCLLLVSMGALASAAYDDQDTGKDLTPVTLAYNFKAGHVSRTQALISIHVMGQEFLVTSVVKSTVKEIDAKGQVTVISETESSKIKFGDAEQDLPLDKPTTSVRDKHGKLVDWKADVPAGSNPEALHLMETLSLPLLPDKAVKAGDTWETELENVAVKGKKVTIKTTYVGKETVEGVETWKIKQSAEADTDKDGNPVSVEGTQWFDPLTGDIVKVEATAKNYPSPQGKADLTVKGVRLKPNKETK